MHELSIVSSIVDTVTEKLEAYPGARVKEVRLRVGALAAVVEDSLQFCYGIATDDTPLQGSKLVVNIVPVMMHCDTLRPGHRDRKPAELSLSALRRAGFGSAAGERTGNRIDRNR